MLEQSPWAGVRVYGWAYTRRFIKKYAEHYRIQIPIGPWFGKKYGKSTIEYGNLSESEAQDSALCGFLEDPLILENEVRLDLSKRGMFLLRTVQPVCEPGRYMGIFAVCNEYNIRERKAQIQSLSKGGFCEALNRVEAAMREVGEDFEKLKWWYDYETVHVVCALAGPSAQYCIDEVAALPRCRHLAGYS